MQGFWRPCKLPYVNILRCRYQRVHKRGNEGERLSGTLHHFLPFPLSFSFVDFSL